MANISEQIYEKRLEQISNPLKDFLSKIFLDKNFLNFIEKHKSKSKNKEDLADNIRNEFFKYSLKLSTTEEFIDSIVEILDLKPEEAEKVIEDFFSICIPQDIQNLVGLQSQEMESTNKNTLEEPKLAEKTESDHISHHDILSEIENPTPSLDTTTDFQNASSVTNIVNTTSTGNVTQPTTSANPVKPSNTTNSNIPSTPTSPSLHSPTPTAPYTNPALQIATKLGQNLSTPSASIPKDIYISKKPDPYHEPVQ